MIEIVALCVCRFLLKFLLLKLFLKVFLNEEQQKEAYPPYPPLEIDGAGCIAIWAGCFLHDPSGSVGGGDGLIGGCNPRTRRK